MLSIKEDISEKAELKIYIFLWLVKVLCHGNLEVITSMVFMPSLR